MSSIEPSEQSRSLDPDTGATVIQWTSAEATNQHLYFTSPSVTEDNRWLVILSDRSGSPNLHVIHRPDGSLRQLSRNTKGLLHAYVYPQGGIQGLSKASPCLDSRRNRLYYIQDDNVHVIHLNDDHPKPETLCKLPAGWWSAFTHISPDGKTLCVPCTDPRAFVDEATTQWEQMKKVAPRMETENLCTHILMIDVPTGTVTTKAEIPFWVTHVQFDPAGSGGVLFNREGFGPNGRGTPQNRIWCLENDGSHHPLSPEPPGEWRSHENWSPDGTAIVYHGGRDGKTFLATRSWKGDLIQETYLRDIKFWHATATVDGNGFFVDQADGFISLVNLNATKNPLTHICRHDSTVEYQDAHPHPITTPEGRSLIFTSNRSGNCQVHEALLPSHLVAPPTEAASSGAVHTFQKARSS